MSGQKSVAEIVEEFKAAYDLNNHSPLAPFLEMCQSGKDADELVELAKVVVGLTADVHAMERHPTVELDFAQIIERAKFLESLVTSVAI